MKVVVAGGGGAVGIPLITRLKAAGHEVTGLTRGGPAAERIRQAGGIAAACDVFDPDGLKDAVAAAEPDVVINQLTSLPPKFEPRRKDFYEKNNRIRSEGGDNLIEATAAAGAKRFVTQSIAFLYELSGPRVKTEDEAVDRSGMHDAMLGHEAKALADQRFQTVVLRYGFFYGPGTWYAKDGDLADQVRSRKLPIVGKGTGITSFVHVNDAASAAVCALDRGEGIYNVTDDDPAPMSEWLPAFADAVGAKPPRRVPLWLASLIAGKPIARQAVEGRGASNVRAKADLGWEPSIPSWRQGFREAI